MRRYIYIFLLLLISGIVFGQNSSNGRFKNIKVTGKSKLINDVTIGSSSFDASAILTVTSTTQGALMPRMNTTARNNIPTPTDGLLIFNTTTGLYEFFETTWQAIGGGADGNGIYDGNGSLSGNTVVTQGANTLDFTVSAVDGFSVDGTTFSVDANNNRVGIGTATPGNKLVANSTLSADGIFLTKSGVKQVALQYESLGGVLSINNAAGGQLVLINFPGQDDHFNTGKPFAIGTTAGVSSAKLTVNDVVATSTISMSKSGATQSSLGYGALGGFISLRNPANSVDLLAFNGASNPDDFINTGRDFVIGGTVASARLTIIGVDATSANDALLITDNVLTPLFKVRNDGLITVLDYIRHDDITASSATSGPTAPTETTVGTFRGLGYDTDNEASFFAIEVPSDWNGTSDMALVVHWYPTEGDAVANTETVKWDITYRSISAGEAVDNGTAVVATATFTGGASEGDKEHYETSITIDFDNANQPLSVDDDIGFQFDRDVTGDTYSGSGIVYKWDLVYTANTIPRGD